MKKNILRGSLALGVLLVLYHLLAFLIPFCKTSVFWIAYGFTLAAFAVAVVSIYIAFIKNPDAKSRFYGFPIARLGILYCAVQIVAGLVFMAVGQWLPGWVAIVICALGLGAAVLGLISAEAVHDEIRTQDAKLQKNVALMRTLQSRLNPLSAQCADPDAAKAVKAFAEELRYSDPVSSDALAEIEADLSAVVDDLQQAVVDGDSSSVKQLCRKATTVLLERNRLCKLHKG